MDLIARRSDRLLEFNELSWMVATDARGLGLEDCGCGEKVLVRQVVRANNGVVLVTYWHPGSLRCSMAFEGALCRPLSWQDYCKLMGIESDFEVDDGA